MEADNAALHGCSLVVERTKLSGESLQGSDVRSPLTRP
jgi:hypothetical protein